MKPLTNNEQEQKTAWDFVEKYYPNYSSSNEILEEQVASIKLENLLTQKDEEKTEALTKHVNELRASIFEAAIKGFLNTKINYATLTKENGDIICTIAYETEEELKRKALSVISGEQDIFACDNFTGLGLFNVTFSDNSTTEYYLTDVNLI